MKKQIFLLICSAVLAFGYKNISADEVADFAAGGDAVVVDVRLDEEWQESGVIKGALLATYFDKYARPMKDDFLKKLSAATGGDKNRPVVLVCRTGLRSKLVAGVLEREGYKSVYNYKEGMVDWLSQKKSVVRPK